VLFAIALTQNAYCTTSQCRAGYDAFICGALLGFMTGGGACTWIANPLLFIAWTSTRKSQTLSRITSIMAALIAASFLCFYGTGDNEAGQVNKIVSYNQGYWLWLSSNTAMAIGSIVLYFPKKKTTIALNKKDPPFPKDLSKLN